MRLRFILSQAALGIRRNIAMTLAVILVTCVSLFFVGTGILSQMQVAQVKGQWYARVEVSIYMCASGDVVGDCGGKEATETQIEAVRQRLASPALARYIKSVHFQDRKEAYEEFHKVLGDTTLGQSLTEDMLPQSFRVKLNNPADYKLIASEIAGREGVQSVKDQRQIVEPLLKALNRATAVSLILAGLMVIAAILLITTTIRLSAMARRKETAVMRFVGASNLFIQLPFMIEGAVATLIGALAAVGGLWLALSMGVEGWIANSFPYISFVGPGDLVIVGPVLVGAALVLALIASMVSLGKYTKV